MAHPVDRQSSHAVYRHGDVLVAAVASIPKAARRLPHLVLAEGELTGHSHRVADPATAFLFRSGEELYLEVVADVATLIHQEHGPIELPRGYYRAWRQREYTPREIRVIRD